MKLKFKESFKAQENKKANQKDWVLPARKKPIEFAQSSCCACVRKIEK